MSVDELRALAQRVMDTIGPARELDARGHKRR
jgi:hypothetical protein